MKHPGQPFHPSRAQVPSNGSLVGVREVDRRHRQHHRPISDADFPSTPLFRRRDANRIWIRQDSTYWKSY